MSLPLHMLFARLQLLAPEARSVLVAAPRSTLEVQPVVDCLFRLVEASQYPVRRVLLPSGVDEPGQRTPVEAAARTGYALTESDDVLLDVADTADVRRLQEVIRRFAGFSVVNGRGILDSAATALAVASVDAVVVVVRRGTTSREDLKRVRIEVDRAGGRLVGAVFQP